MSAVFQKKVTFGFYCMTIKFPRRKVSVISILYCIRIKLYLRRTYISNLFVYSSELHQRCEELSKLGMTPTRQLLRLTKMKFRAQISYLKSVKDKQFGSDCQTLPSQIGNILPTGRVGLLTEKVSLIN